MIFYFRLGMRVIIKGANNAPTPPPTANIPISTPELTGCIDISPKNSP